MTANDLDKIRLRLLSINKLSHVGYTPRVYSPYINEFLEKLSERSVEENSAVIKGLLKSVDWLLNKKSITGGWTSPEVESFFPNPKLPKTEFNTETGEEIDLGLSEELIKMDEERYLEESEAYFGKLKDFQKRASDEVRKELIDMRTVLVELDQENTRRVDVGNKTIGFTVKGNKNWVHQAYLALLKAGAFSPDCPYDRFKQLFEGEEILIPINIAPGFQGVVALIMKRVFDHNLLLEQKNKWQRVSSAFYFNGEPAKPRDLGQVKPGNLSEEKLQLVNMATSYF